MINKKGWELLSRFTYTYDANGNITSVNDGLTTKNYVYDKLNRLIEVQHQNGNKITYSYDSRGNRRTEVGGNFNLNLDISYSYDQENRLKTVTKGISTKAASMSYYADGMRAKKESPSGGTTNYIYNLSGKLVAEAVNSSMVTSNYIWGPDRVLAKHDNVEGEDYYYLYNGHGDVVQIVDRDGNIVNNYEYDEWGSILFSKETVSNPFKYAGEVYDQETGLYYLRARYYDPKIGRFINEDTYEGQVNDPLSMNLYTYCKNNPIKYIDPMGHKELASNSSWVSPSTGNIIDIKTGKVIGKTVTSVSDKGLNFIANMEVGKKNLVLDSIGNIIKIKPTVNNTTIGYGYDLTQDPLKTGIKKATNISQATALEYLKRVSNG